MISLMILNNQLMNGLITNLVLNTNIGHWRLKNSKLGIQYRAYGADIVVCSCGIINPFTIDQCQSKSGIYPDKYDIDAINVGNTSEPSISFHDWITSCMPVDSCLLSSLECFYDQNCVDSILPFLQVLDNMPIKNFTALNSSISSRYNISSEIFSIVEEFMVEDWLLQESYDEYFLQCAPISCTYWKSVRPNFLKVLKTVIGLLGGLCAVLLLIIPLIVKKIRDKFWPIKSNAHISTPIPQSHVSSK